MTVPEGSVYALIGSNGVGKSTTLKLLLNLLGGYSGRASVFGVECARVGPREYARIGYVSENQELPEWMTVAEFLAFWRPFYPNWDPAREDELLRLFALPLDRKLRDLSRGMRMKAALTSSLCYRPELLILDEPFSGLDPLVRDELAEALLEQSDSSTVLICSHDLAEIESFASHIAFLDQGRLRFAEAMSGLTDRFREVEITMEAARLPERWPQHWYGAEAGSAVVRFVETRFDAAATERTVRELFPEARQVELRAMPLRAIFVALARKSREAA